MLRTFGLMPTPTLKKEKKFTKKERDEAKAAAEKAKPLIYAYPDLGDDQDFEFVTFGCQGTANGAQAAVADAIDAAIEAGEIKPKFILLLGDNLYPKGVKSPRSSQFETAFQDPYRKLIQRGIPFFVIPGNHDYDMRDEAQFLPASTQGTAQILNEVAYTYLPGKEGSTADKVNLFSGKHFNHAKLGSWNMPALRYGLAKGGIICMDSNTYIAAYLIKDQAGQTIKNNQALWVAHKTAKAKAAGRSCILALHHPLDSPGKRAFKNDLKLYLSKTQRDEIRAEFPEFNKHHTPYNTYLKACLAKQGLLTQYDLFLTAHDHNQYYYNNGVIKQLTLGGGGGPLQPRCEFKHQAELACFIKDHGYGVVKMKRARLNKPERIKFSIHSLHQPTLFFSNQSVQAKQKPFNDEALEKIKTAVTDAVNDYFQFIATKQTADRKTFLLTNVSHGHHEIECAHQAWNLVNANEVPSYEKLTKALYALVRKTEPFFTETAEHAFSRILDKTLSREFGEGTTLKNLAKNPAATNPRRPQSP